MWFGEKISQENKKPSDCHLMYPNQCNCSHDSHDDDGDEMYAFSPPLNVKDIPWFINKPRKCTDWVHKTNCICKYVDLHIADRKENIYCLAEDVLFHHRYEALYRHHSTCCFCT